MDQPPLSSQASLQPRARRLLSFGDVLDESIQLFRDHWMKYALVSAVALLPQGFIEVWIAGSGLTSRSISLLDLQTGARPAPAPDLAGLSSVVAAGTIVSALLWPTMRPSPSLRC